MQDTILLLTLITLGMRMPSLLGLWYSPVKWLEYWSRLSCGREISFPVEVTAPTQACKSCQGSWAESLYDSKVHFIPCVSFCCHSRMQRAWRQELSLMETEQCLTPVDVCWMLNNSSDHVIRMPSSLGREYQTAWKFPVADSMAQEHLEVNLKTSVVQITFPIRNPSSSLE